MPLSTNIMRGGTSAGQAKAINNGAIASAVSAAGTTITDATDLLADINFVSTVASGAGVQLSHGEAGDSQIVYNAGANALKVYPSNSSASINTLSAGVAHNLPINTMCTYYKVSSTQWIANLSA